MQDAKASANKDKLTSAQFEGLLQRLDLDRERAAQAYEKLRRQLIKFFEWNCGCVATDLVDDTFDRVAQRLGTLEVPDLVAFTWGVARKVRQEAEKRGAKMIGASGSDEESTLGDHGTTEEQLYQKIDAEQQLRGLYRCVQRLGIDDQKLFWAYYRPGQHPTARKQLAESLGLTMNALRVRMNRLRERVEQCTEKYSSSIAQRSNIERGEKLASMGSDE
jgi:DNA-directed RNA polymerase specialized sigma24 family protein